MTSTLRTEGAILPADLIRRIAEGDGGVPGLTPTDYHLSGERINEAVNRAWNRLTGAWRAFRSASASLGPDAPGVRITRERWLLPLFQELGYGRLLPQKAVEIDGKAYPVSHAWHHAPIHLIGCGVDLDRRAAGVVGAARMSPHATVQELLNRSDDRLWGFVGNGLKLRILRDNVSLTRQAFVEFDLEAIMEGEVYADFVLLWLLCHESRVAADRPEDCWLERWSRLAHEGGARALESLRAGVEGAIRSIGAGFLAHPGNTGLRRRLKSGDLDRHDYYRQILRFVYRLIFVFVAEDRGLLLDPAADPEARDRYRRWYSTRRLRRLAARRAGTRHVDCYHGLRLVLEGLGHDGGRPELALPALGSSLFSPDGVLALADSQIANRDLLAAVRAVSFIVVEGKRRPVDFKNLDAEELGSVYESLLELHPEINADAGTFDLKTAGGSERKTTGSYYTPPALVRTLLDSALAPVLADAARQPDPEAAILALNICDPACGSGHFLVAAARRMAKALAAIRTGDEEPGPDAIQRALRDVIGRCIHGVDANPMAVELCKLNLWLASVDPGKPLSFLDHHIQPGNSLIGATPALLDGGIPDDAFTPIEGDDKAFCRQSRKRNKAERDGQLTLFDAAGTPWREIEAIAEGLADLNAIDDGDMAGIREKQRRYEAMVQSGSYRSGRLRADTWCAAFVWVKRATEELRYPITEDLFRQIERAPAGISPAVIDEIDRLSRQYQFFHWHIAFPDVFAVTGDEPDAVNLETGWSGGFDVVLGNPPWERIKLQEKEWFARRMPEIADAGNAAARKRMIESLKTSDPTLHRAFLADKRKAEGESHFVRHSGRFPLCGRGDVNTYSVFTETKRGILSPGGRVGCIVPSGIATDDTTKLFFQDLMTSKALVSLYDFWEIRRFFLDTDSRSSFCLLTLTGPGRPATQGAEFTFSLHDVAELRDRERRFVLTDEDIARINPNTRTCPLFRSRRDAEITKAIYGRVPVLIREADPDGNPWGISFMRMFDMANDSKLFWTRSELEKDGWELSGNVFQRGGERMLPLYEAKMIHQFDHRWVSYKEGGDTYHPLEYDKENSCFTAMPRYWVSYFEVARRKEGKTKTNWNLGWRDICRSTDERTVIASVAPEAGVGDTFLLLFSYSIENFCILSANLNSFVFDYIARQKIGGTHLKYHVFKQLSILSPSNYLDIKLNKDSMYDWIKSRLLELTYTAYDLRPFAQDLGYTGPPFRWDPARRFLIRCELDAAYFHLYGIDRDDVDYIMETFPIVKRKDEKAHGEFRTKRVILQTYDAMAGAIRTGEPYRTALDPPPGDRRAVHEDG